MHTLVKAILLGFLSIILSFSVNASDVETANKLISEGKYLQAFELLEPLEFDLSGDESFDTLFGFSALETGHVSLATLAFERVLAVNPDNVSARLHLGRAYYALNDSDGARREFEILLSLNPDSQVQETVGQYLDAIAARKPQSKTSYSAHISLGYGYDSNASGGTSLSSIRYDMNGDDVIDSLDTLYRPSDLGLDVMSDNYTNFSTAIDVVHRSSNTKSYYLGGGLTHRGHNEQEAQDYGLLSAKGGLQFAFDNQSIRTGLNLSRLDVDGSSYPLDTIGLDFEWRNTIQQKTQLGLETLLKQNRHEDDSLDYDDLTLRFSLLRIVGEQGTNSISGSLESGHETSINGRDDGDADYIKASMTGQVKFSDDHTGFAVISAQQKDYELQDDSFLVKRSDSQKSLMLGVISKLSKTVSIRTILSATETESNVKWLTNDRNDISVTLRKDFY